MALSQREQQQVEQANASGNTPVVFIHGLLEFVKRFV
jgi:hypothetical protein